MILPARFGFEEQAMPKQHFGQHVDCYPCKLMSLHFVDSQPKVHAPPGNRWEHDPVKDRIEDLGGVTIDTDHMERQSRV